ncbi:hypothetical protein BCR34DRAFT_575326 [Clohesyomyces aquaticus]|uniref:Cyanovirin-N domain-containing protein n=1 Tax=Clohesyomyces aquaticus TaxID=1231657 RepID=A0A1Y1YTB0_9PLEO|nr:hypothetical protein BCR34DRAFT_575326 [Clohesyomyces aquaticus]
MLTFLLPAFLGLALHVPSTYAVPASVSIARATSVISNQCINHEYRDEWFVADCLTGEDATTRIQSAVWLNNKVANLDGELKWDVGGGFTRSCTSCKIINAGATFTCSCGTTWHSGKNVSRWDGTLDLDEHISLYSGQLLSNYPSAPKTPSAPLKAAPYPVPKTFKYSFGGTASCPNASASEPGRDYCNWLGNCTATSFSAWTYQGPIQCYVPVIYFPDVHYIFSELKIEAEGAYEVLGYADENCEGGVVEKVGPESGGIGVCKALGTPVKAVTVRPLFMGDPN